MIKEFENQCKVNLDFIDPDYDVYVYLPEHRESRFAGKFDPNTGVMFLKRFEKHRHRILNAYGISAYVIEALEPMGLKLFSMEVADTRETFEVTLEKLKIEATWKFWRDGGFDRQAFVPLPLWTKK